LIEAAGLKGLYHGGARVSKLHANFIINTGGATAVDVFLLIREIQTRVHEHTGIRLKPEIRFMGDWRQELQSAYVGALLEPNSVVS
jgi:UDP-N-acetylmuramate dehydrogenase